MVTMKPSFGNAVVQVAPGLVDRYKALGWVVVRHEKPRKRKQ